MLEKQRERVLSVMVKTRELDADPSAKPVSPMLVGTKGDEDRIVIVWPPHEYDQKEFVYQAAAMMVGMAGCDGLVFGSDAWVTKVPKNESIEDVQLPVRENPQRRDAFIITALRKGEDMGEGDVYVYEMVKGKVTITEEVKKTTALEGWITSLFRSVLEFGKEDDASLEDIVELAQASGWQVEVRP